MSYYSTVDFLEHFYDYATDHWPEYLTLFLAGSYYIPLLWRRYQNSRLEKNHARAKKRLDEITKPGYIEQQKWLRNSFAIKGLGIWAMSSYFESLRFVYSLPPLQKERGRLAIAAILLMLFQMAAFWAFVRSSSHHGQTDERWLEKQRGKLSKIVDDYNNRPPEKPAH